MFEECRQDLGESIEADALHENAGERREQLTYTLHFVMRESSRRLKGLAKEQ